MSAELQADQLQVGDIVHFVDPATGKPYRQTDAYGRSTTETQYWRVVQVGEDIELQPILGNR